MKISHFHVSVQDLNSALQWLERVLEVRPTFQDDRLASVPFGDFIIIVDKADRDVPVTIGFDSKDCDGDYRRLIERGALSLEEPTDRSWGVRSAYLHGPGAVRVEIEQPLSGAK